MEHDSKRQDRREQDKLQPGDLTEHSPFLRWLDNFWFYNKWKILIGGFFLVVFIIGFVQVLSQDKYDTTVAVACAYRMDTEEREKFSELLAKFCPEDYDGNGEKAVNLRWYEVYSEDEYKEAASEAAAESAASVINSQYNSEEYQNFNAYILTGDSSVVMVSPYLYSILVSGGRLMSVSEVYGDSEFPTGVTEDGYGIYLSQTDFYQYNQAAQPLPDTTILCLLRATISGEAAHEDTYSHSVAMFRALADYQVSE
jgi:hypothetical protein